MKNFNIKKTYLYKHELDNESQQIRKYIEELEQKLSQTKKESEILKGQQQLLLENIKKAIIELCVSEPDEAILVSAVLEGYYYLAQILEGKSTKELLDFVNKEN